MSYHYLCTHTKKKKKTNSKIQFLYIISFYLDFLQKTKLIFLLVIISNPIWRTGRGVMVFSTTFNNILAISWRSVVLVEETGVLGENHWSAASHWQTLTHNVVSSTPHLRGIFELTTLVVMGTDCICSYKSTYHTIITMTTPVV